VTEPDEISQGPEEEPHWSRGVRLPGWLRGPWVRGTAVAVVVAVTVVVGGGALLNQPVSSPGGRPTTGSADPAASDPDSAGPGVSSQSLLPADFVAVGEICPSVTDGRHTLTVSFTLRNIAQIPITIRSVQPLLPLGGLTTVSTDISGGTCAASAGAPADLVIPVGDDVVVTFRFLLPATCPQPLPIAVRTVFLIGPASSGEASGAPGVSLLQDDVGVFDDLGAIKFDTCTPST
jgi:hypothetical protein